MIGIGLSPLGAAIGSASVWTPANDIANIRVAYTPSGLLGTPYQQYTGTPPSTLATAADDPVGSLYDEVSEIYYRSIADSARRPVLGTAPANFTTFVASDSDVMAMAAAPLSGSAQLTVVSAISITSKGADFVVFESGAPWWGGTGTFGLVYVSSSDRIAMGYRGTVLLEHEFAAPAASSFFILACQMDMAETGDNRIKFRVNGSQLTKAAESSSAGSGSAFNTNDLYIGSRDLGSLFADMRLGDTFFLDGAANVANYEAYLADLYGVTLA